MMTTLIAPLSDRLAALQAPAPVGLIPILLPEETKLRHAEEKRAPLSLWNKASRVWTKSNGVGLIRYWFSWW
jgi:hypothetical protein